jgi:hypothetical protein
MSKSPDHSVASARPPLKGSADLFAAGAPANLLAHIKDGEQLIWWGRPSPAAVRSAFTWRFWIAVILSLFFWGPVIWTLAHALFIRQGPIPGIGLFIWAVFCLMAVLLTYCAYYARIRIINCHDIAYGLTNTRLILATAQLRAESFNAHAFRKMRRDQNTIHFDYRTHKSPDHRVGGAREFYHQALVGILDAGRVERLLRETFPLKH